MGRGKARSKEIKKSTATTHKPGHRQTAVPPAEKNQEPASLALPDEKPQHAADASSITAGAKNPPSSLPASRDVQGTVLTNIKTFDGTDVHLICKSCNKSLGTTHNQFRVVDNIFGRKGFLITVRRVHRLKPQAVRKRYGSQLANVREFLDLLCPDELKIASKDWMSCKKCKKTFALRATKKVQGADR
ncbi:hypothetical protein KEM56_005330 [Ascosphaera pollenicola]|nr:hypothetical protein KEM56_005330 [Ascosphaera pollenicola]